ncbi:MAG: ROK family protein [Bacteroidota bacterium]
MEILGLDIGGTGIKGAIVNTTNGELVTERHRIPTPQPATPEAMIDTVAEIVKHFDWHGPMGCGFPAAVKHEIIKTASNIDKRWIGVNAAKAIHKKTKCEAHLLNDVDAAGYAEVTFGAGKGNRGAIIMAAFGTGIGTALFTEGRLFPNTELGHLKMKGTIAEKYTSNMIREREDLDWEEFGKRVNKYLKRLEALFWPDLIIFGGGVSKKFENFSEYIDIETEVQPASLRNHAGIIGAAVAARHAL